MCYSHIEACTISKPMEHIGAVWDVTNMGAAPTFVIGSHLVVDEEIPRHLTSSTELFLLLTHPVAFRLLLPVGIVVFEVVMLRRI